MAAELLTQRKSGLVVVAIGGASDTHETFARELQPYIFQEHGHHTIVEFIPGRWRDRREKATQKIERVYKRLSEIVEEHGRIDALVGISNGSPLSVAASTQDGVNERIGKWALISGVLRRPEKWTPWKLIATQIYPALSEVVEEAVDNGLPKLSPRIANGDVLSVRGIRDRMVAPYLSIISGAGDRNVEYPTSQHLWFSTHSDNIRGTFRRLPVFHTHIEKNAPAL